MRCGERLGLEWSDIDFKNKTIKVSGTLVYVRGGKGRFKDTPKTGSSSREIPMIDHVEAVLKSRRRQQMETKLLMGKRWVPDTGLENTVFTYETGTTFRDTAVRVDMKKIVSQIRAAGVEFEDITPHTFRNPKV